MKNGLIWTILTICQIILNFVGNSLNILRYFGLEFQNLVLSMII